MPESADRRSWAAIAVRSAVILDKVVLAMKEALRGSRLEAVLTVLLQSPALYSVRFVCLLLICVMPLFWAAAASTDSRGSPEEGQTSATNPAALLLTPLWLLLWLFGRICGCPKDAQTSGSPSAGRVRPTLSAVARSLRSLGRATAGKVPSRRLRGRSDGGEKNVIKLDVGFDPPARGDKSARKASRTAFPAS